MEETKTMEAPQAAAIGAEQVKKLTEVLQKYKTGKSAQSSGSWPVKTGGSCATTPRRAATV